MFIFAPGAGCSGEAKLVKPGDELIFSSEKDWEECGSTCLFVATDNFQGALTSTCPAGSIAPVTHQYNAPLSDDVLVKLSHKNFSKETMKKVRWVRKMYNEWRAYRHANGFEFITCDIEDPKSICEESLTFALCRFITEVKKVNSEDFPGKTLYDIIICIQFHLECLGFSYKLINHAAFKDLKFTLDNTMKMRTASV